MRAPDCHLKRHKVNRDAVTCLQPQTQSFLRTSEPSLMGMQPALLRDVDPSLECCLVFFVTATNKHRQRG